MKIIEKWKEENEMKKRLFAALLAFTLVFGLGACGSGDEKDPENGQKPGVEQGEDDGNGGDEDQSADGDVGAPDGDAGGDADSGSGGPQTGGSGDADKPSQGAPKPGGTQGNTSGGGGSQSGNTSAKPAISGSFSEIIKNIYDKTGYDVQTSETEVTADNAEYYLGSSDIKFKKALASEPMMSSIAHSVVLLEAEDGADLAAIKKKIKENVNGYKWVCVGVEDENILVGNVGNYILLVMDEDAQSFMDAFTAMGK